MTKSLVTCGRCKGHGVIQDYLGFDQTCPVCGGVGKKKIG